MKLSYFGKTLFILLFFPSTLCFSKDVPSNSLQVEYKQQNDLETLLNLDTLYRVPVATYQYLDDIFTSFYNTLTFNTSITDSTFKSSAHYELIAIPLLAENNKGVNIEVFGNFSDPTTQHLSNFSTDQVLYNYLSHTEQMRFYQSSLALGAGISFHTSENSKIKVIISSHDIPGYGNSNALLGFETSF